MNMAVEAELRLVQVIREARQLVADMNELKKEFLAKMDTLPKSQAVDRQFLKQQVFALTSKINILKQQMDSSHIAATKMHGNLKWRDAVLALYGQEGYQACIAYFQGKEASAPEQQTESKE